MQIDWDKSKTRIPPTRRIDAAMARDKLYGRLRQYRLDTALGVINRVFVTYTNRELREKLPKREQEYWMRAILPHQLANLAKMFIQVSNDHKANNLTWNELSVCVNAWHDLQGATPSQDFALPDWEAFLLRTAFQQFRLQRSPAASLPRSILLFDRIARRPEFASEFDIPNAFEDLTGLTLNDAIIFAVWWWLRCGMHTQQSPFVQLTEFVRRDLPWASEERVRRFLDFAAINYENFRAECEKWDPEEPYLAVYAYNPLEARPIVQTRRSAYVVPIPPYLLEHVGMGVYYELIKVHGNRFTNIFGKLFEGYVGDLLREVYPAEHILRELQYGREKGNLSSDWVVVEGRSATLIECKITRLRLTTKIRGAIDDLREDLPRGLAKAVSQLYRVTRAIRHREPGLEPLHNVESIVPVVVLLDDFYLANTSYIRELVAAQLRRDGIQDFEYQVIAIEDLEDYLAAGRELGLAKMLRRKMSEVDLRWHSDAYMEFWQYIEAAAPGRRKRSPMLRRAWTELFEGFRDRFPELRGTSLADIEDEDYDG